MRHTGAQIKFKLDAKRVDEIRRNPPLNMSSIEGAAFTGLSDRAFRGLLYSHAIKSAKVGGRRIVRLKDIESYLDRRTV